MLAHYYNKAAEWGKEVVVTYKWHHLPPGTGVVDLELGRHDTLTYHEWLTDTTVDDGGLGLFEGDRVQVDENPRTLFDRQCQ